MEQQRLIELITHYYIYKEYELIIASTSTRWWQHELPHHDGSNLRYHVVFHDSSQQKKQKEIRKFQNSLQEGSKVVTGGGVYGTVKHINLEQNTVDVEVARGVVITVAKNYVFADATAQVNA